MTISINSEGYKKREAVSNPSGLEGYICGGVIDDKKRRRMESNRESARRSRQKKQQHLDGLIQKLGSLKRQNQEFDKMITEYKALFSAMEYENGVLKAEKDGLAARLEGLENVIRISRVDRGSLPLGNGDSITMKPWKLPCYSSPTTSSALPGFNFNFNF